MLSSQDIQNINNKLQEAIKPLERDKAIIDAFLSKPKTVTLSANNFSLNIADRHLPALLAFFKKISHDYESQIQKEVQTANKVLLEGINNESQSQIKIQEIAV